MADRCLLAVPDSRGSAQEVRLSRTDARAKRKILGLNSAKLYGIEAVDTGAYKAVPKDYESRMSGELKTVLEFGQLRADNMTKMKDTYARLRLSRTTFGMGG